MRERQRRRQRQKHTSSGRLGRNRQKRRTERVKTEEKHRESKGEKREKKTRTVLKANNFTPSEPGLLYQGDTNTERGACVGRLPKRQAAKKRGKGERLTDRHTQKEKRQVRQAAAVRRQGEWNHK